MLEAFVLAQVRTPRGKGSARGALAAIAPGELVRQLLVSLLARGVEADAVDDIVLGCASQLDAQGGNLARAAAIAACAPASSSAARPAVRTMRFR